MALGRDVSVSHRKVKAWQLISLWWGCLPVISVSAEQVQVCPIICCENIEAVQPKQSGAIVPVITKQWSVNVPQSNLNPFFKACCYLLSQMPVTNFIKATVLSTHCGFCSLTSSTVAWRPWFAFIATINLQKIKRSISPLYKVLQSLHLQTKANRFTH